MPFQRKSIVIRPELPGGESQVSCHPKALSGQWKYGMSALLEGVRPSPLDGRSTISTGTASFDQILAGHAGLPLGNCLLIEENRATDFGGVVQRYSAAEGLVQGHHVHVLGYGAGWRSELPGLRKLTTSSSEGSTDDHSGCAWRGKNGMKIAWRYETLESKDDRVKNNGRKFCHSFDLGKRLEAIDIRGLFVPYPLMQQGAHGGTMPQTLVSLLGPLQERIRSSPATVHRVIVPGFLSPGVYSTTYCHPADVLQFLCGLRALARRHAASLAVIVSLPVSLHPRSDGLTRWIEHLCDSVVELSCGALAGQEVSQGQMQIHSLPVHHERGGGPEAGGWWENFSFKISGTGGLVIKPFNLPPVGEVNPEGQAQPMDEVKGAEKFEF